MKWYLAKIVFRIICADGNHTAQFDEQLRLVFAHNAAEAFGKAQQMGNAGEECFYNVDEQMVQWKFINVSELYPLKEMTDGAELYSQISETNDAKSYIDIINNKARYTRNRETSAILELL